MRVAVFVVDRFLGVLAAWLGVARAAFLGNAEQAAGRAMALNAGGSHPKTAFDTRDGAGFRYSQGGLVFGYREGDAVTVSFRPANPRGSACATAFGAVWGEPLMAAVAPLASLTWASLAFYRAEHGCGVFRRER